MTAFCTPSHDGAALRHFQDHLSAEGFEGELVRDVGARLVAATDNSICQVTPEAVLYPRTHADLNRCVRAAQHAKIALSPRGGGTGTNGQSLTRGVMVDLSRHLNSIRSLDVEAATVTVEPGVVLDQLNSFLAEHDLFFAPMVSTGSRATIGGMIATDAFGKGSRLYGKTSATSSRWRSYCRTEATGQCSL
jgi:FAD/FMN-containing dehydrogenase